MKKESLKTQKGITLIALIITVIVMLILVGVTVSTALNTGLFKAAQGVAKNTDLESYYEKEMSDGMINVDDEWVNINDYVNSLLEEKEYILTVNPGMVTAANLMQKGMSTEARTYSITNNTTFQDLINSSNDFSTDNDGYVIWLELDYFVRDFYDESTGVEFTITKPSEPHHKVVEYFTEYGTGTPYRKPFCSYTQMSNGASESSGTTWDLSKK